MMNWKFAVVHINLEQSFLPLNVKHGLLKLFQKGSLLYEEHAVTLMFPVPKESYTIFQTFPPWNKLKTIPLALIPLHQISIQFVHQDALHSQQHRGERS